MTTEPTYRNMRADVFPSLTKEQADMVRAWYIADKKAYARELLGRVRDEVIGENQPDISMANGDYSKEEKRLYHLFDAERLELYRVIGRNQIREEQRKAIDTIEGEL